MGFTSNIKKVNKQLDDWQSDVLKVVGKYVEGEAKLRCPVGHYTGGMVGGNLNSSINYKTLKKSVIIGSNVEYAIFVEKGTGKFNTENKGRKTPWKYKDEFGFWHITSGMKAQPFLTPAVEENMGKIKSIVKKVKVFHGIS